MTISSLAGLCRIAFPVLSSTDCQLGEMFGAVMKRCRTNVARDPEEDRKQSKNTETDEGPNSLLQL